MNSVTEQALGPMRCPHCGEVSDVAYESEGIERELEVEDGYYIVPLASLTMTIMRAGCEHMEAIADHPLWVRIEED